jgi:eukaryotic-like serine/threonine-protein kinase
MSTSSENPQPKVTADALLFEALELPPERRDAFLAEACPGEAMLLEVKSLLRAHDSAGAFLDQPATLSGALKANLGEAAAAPHAGHDAMIGRRIGPYRIDRRIGTGGMGDVYLAQRDDDVFDRQVAVKIIRAGLLASGGAGGAGAAPSAETIHRFEQERRVLASLDHPNIARLIDAGSIGPSEQLGAQPYLIMEYVGPAAQTIDRYCDSHRLTIDQRLDLFLAVCDAVQFAHQNLVVHRDLKPGNILVTEDGMVKLLDFGIAKLLSDARPGADATLTVERRLTPAYASPEQLRPRADRPITTASDMYSLGVILYELLTGRKPYRVSATSPHDWAGLERAVCEEPPTRPSTAVRDGSIDLAAARRIDARRLQRRLRGDLETIMLMALRKEPHRRYASVEQLAQDIRRHRQSLPVTARLDTFLYRTGKFISRNRVGFGAAMLILLMLFGGLALTTSLYLRAENALAAAASERDRAQQAEERATRRFEDVRELAHGLIFDVYDDIRHLPGSSGPGGKIVGTAQRYLERLSAEAEDDHGLLLDIAAAHRRLGDVQGGLEGEPGLGNMQDAMVSYTKALNLARRVLEDGQGRPSALSELDRAHIHAARSLRGLGLCQVELGEYEEAERSFNAAIEHRGQVEDGELKHTAPTMHGMRSEIAKLREREGRMDEAIAIRREILDAQVRDPFPDSSAQEHELALYHVQLGRALFLHGQLDDAEPHLRETIQLQQELAARHPERLAHSRFAAAAKTDLARLIARRGDLEEGTAMMESAMEEMERLVALDPLNRSTLHDLTVAHRFLGEFNVMRGRYEEGLRHYERSVELRRSLSQLDPASLRAKRDLAAATDQMATALWRLDRFDEALHHHLAARDVFAQIARERPEMDHQRSLSVSEYHLGELYAALARRDGLDPPERAERLHSAADHYRRALDILVTIREQGMLAGGDEYVIPMLETKIADVLEQFRVPSSE